MNKRRASRNGSSASGTPAAGAFDAAALFERAQQLQQSGDLTAAATAYRALIRRAPRHAPANHLLGLIELQQGRAAAAVELISIAIEVMPDDFHAQLNLGAAFMALGRAADALRCCERAVALNPGIGLAWTNRGNALLALKQAEAALASYLKALACDPRDPRAHCNLGNALREVGRPEEALARYHEALALKPDYVLALRNRASLLHALGRAGEALACAEAAARLAPDDTAVLTIGGNSLLALSRPRDAAAYFERALAVDPDLGEALNNLGIALLQIDAAPRALDCFDRLLEKAPDSPGPLCNRGEALRRLNRFADAAHAYERALALAPEVEFAAGKLLHVQLLSGDWSAFFSRKAAIEAGVERGQRVCAPFEFLAISGSAAAQLRCAQLYAANIAAKAAATPAEHAIPAQQAIPATQAIPGAARPRAAGSPDRLRVAYVSADFGNRPVAHLLAGVLGHHDPEHFEIIGVSLRPADSSALGRRIVGNLQRYVDVSAHSDAEVVDMLRDMDVHIAVDLMGYTHGARPALFARRAAPVQVSYLGFSGTMGSTWIDHMIADDVTVPSAHEPFFSERIVRLPHCFLPNDDDHLPVAAAPSRRELGLPDAGIVFCAFHNAYKLNPLVFGIWMRLLERTSGSVLWLAGGEPAIRGNLEREAAARGVDPARLVFAPKIVDLDAHLARYAQADLFLDTFPYGAHATARDALWAGLPVLTMAGETFASRIAASLVTALGVPELIAVSPAHYEQRALELSGDRAALCELRGRLALARRTRPVFDSRRYCRDLEAVYRQIWAQHEDAIGESRRRGPPSG